MSELHQQMSQIQENGPADWFPGEAMHGAVPVAEFMQTNVNTHLWVWQFHTGILRKNQCIQPSILQ